MITSKNGAAFAVGAKAGGLAFQRMSTYGLPCILEVMPNGKVYKKGKQLLLEIIGVAAAVTGTIISVIQLVRDIVNERKQKSNRPS